MRFLVAVLARGAGGVVTGGDAIVRDLGRMWIVLWGQMSGVNVTNFTVCCVTMPVVLACFGWDGLTPTRHPMGKLVGDSRFVTVMVVDA